MTSKRQRTRSRIAGAPPLGESTGTWRKEPLIIAVSAVSAASVERTVCGLRVIASAAVHALGSRPAATTRRATSVAVRMPRGSRPP